MVKSRCGRSCLQDVSFIVVMVVLCSVLRVASAYSRAFIMSEYCGDLVDMAHRNLVTVHLRLTERAVYRPHMSCTFGVRAPPGDKLLMVVQWMDIAEGRNHLACADYLSVWNGDFSNRTGYVEGLDARLCGDAAPAPVTSLGRSMLLHFDSNKYEDGSGFEIVFTAYHEGECSKGEFHCDNGRCIDERLACDDYDNCGDDSDSCILSAGKVVVAVVVTTIVFLLIVGIAVLVCHWDKLKLRKKCPIIGANPDGVYQPTTEPVTAPTTSSGATSEATTTATTAV
ncbi:uncharacterized protein LOC143300550 [Babylonia areolata]|uniref:uncharacterized protein LOC143300550 n=1 Tax=Babylonia areolata TaxID=304850 RepID=UPI003FD14DCF